ncbi:MAG: cytochrome-c oxidase, cbb3-type subunit I [Bacteroidetes bacterium]|nr:cytochrome-c oxidase, cbb3-type subunit I [Bacteroidota bacterium]
MENQNFYYDNKIVRSFAYATLFWGVIGMVVGLLVALEFIWPQLSFGLPYLTFGRIRPIHTNAVIFAFVGNGIFTGIYYSLQRLCKARMFSNVLSKIHFWGWQLIIVSAALTFAFGFTTGKEYAELEWPIDIAVAVIWIVFGWNMIGTIIKRRTRHIYVAIWFYLATFVTIAVLHVTNSIEIPVSWLKSYPVYAGVQDALVQWWYGHNAVAFFLTTPFLGLMYYFLPKAANRPIYSYRLSIVHFWALIFLYIWAGPHHLIYSALPNWTQSLGVVFSVMLIAPSWGGMVNGLLTLRGAWDRVREDPVLKFMVVAVTAYGMSTFEGPMMSTKTVNSISHFTDWTVGHAHIGALGWNGFLTFAVLYWLIPRIFQTTLYSRKMANTHFWIGTLGIIFYAVPLYWGAITQFSMWKEFTQDGFLKYPNFLETVTQLKPMYAARAIGGGLYITGALLGIVNLIRTIKAGKLLPEEAASAPALERISNSRSSGESPHRWLERKPVQFVIIALVVILIGGLIEIVPLYLVKTNIPTIASVRPYKPLELQGRDIYVREGCYTCHSQQVRPFRSETERYGEYAKAGEYVYDHPFQWGSKRNGPDLSREGVTTGRQYKPDSWHYTHLLNPQKLNEQSIMPVYKWLIANDLDISSTARKIRVMQFLGVPYPQGFDKTANENLLAQATAISNNLKSQGIQVEPGKEVIAVIAYLQRLGKDVHTASQIVTPPTKE